MKTTATPKDIEFALKEWAEVYKRLPRIDYMFVPGGRPRPHPARSSVRFARTADGAAQKIPSERRNVDVAAELQRGMDGRILRLDGQAAGVAGRHRFRPAANASACRSCGGAFPQKYPIRRYPRHHAQPALPVPGSRLGPSPTPLPRPARSSTPAGRSGAHLPPARRVRGRLSDILRRQPRRRQQVHLERPRLGAGAERRRYPARLLAVLYRAGLRRFVGAGNARSRAQLAGARWRRTKAFTTTLARFRSMEKTASPQLKLNGGSSTVSTAPTTTPTTAAACSTKPRSKTKP